MFMMMLMVLACWYAAIYMKLFISELEAQFDKEENRKKYYRKEKRKQKNFISHNLP